MFGVEAYAAMGGDRAGQRVCWFMARRPGLIVRVVEDRAIPSLESAMYYWAGKNS